jgi:hypothetical protein
MIYQAILPPAEATCDSARCGTSSMVRLIVPASRFDADDAAHQGTWDSCDLHWPAFRDTTARNGHRILDATGDPRQLLTEYPGWRIFRSDMGRLYASRPGTTVYGWLTAQLRAEIQKRQASLGTVPPGSAS